jgi:putative ABC transport system permease protein
MPNRLIRVSGWWVRRLLRMFPAEFQRSCGSDITFTFDDLVRDRYAAEGPLGVVAATARVTVDLVWQAVGERRQRYTHQSTSLRLRPRQTGGIMTGLLQDLRYAHRALLRAPGLALTLVLTLGLGIGGTTAMFSVVHGVLLKPLPFPDSERVVRLCEVTPATASVCVASAVNVADLGRTTTTVEAAGVARGETFLWSADGRDTTVRGVIATAGFFRAVGAGVSLGRLLEPGDDGPGSNQVAVVTHRFWASRLGGDPAVVGRTISLDSHDVRVIGVLAPDSFIPEFASADLWKPLSASVDDVSRRSWRGFVALAKAAPGVSPEAFAASLTTSHAALRAEFPSDNGEWTLRVEGLRERLIAPVRPTLLVFQGAAILVLLIASANAAGLLLVRAATRSQEFAVRTALGAGQARMVRQLLAEGMLLSLGGVAVGLLFASQATNVIVRLAPTNIPRLPEVSLDSTVAAFAFGVAALTTLVFGFAPLRRPRELSAALRGQRVLADRSQLRTASVVVQLTLAFALLLGASQLGRAFLSLAAWEPGFERDGLVISWLIAPPGVFQTTDNAVAALTRARDHVATLPGVTAVGLTSAGPLFGGVETGKLLSRRDGADAVDWFDADAHYLGAIGATLVQGRDFAPTDSLSASPVAVVNETFVRRYLGERDPIGARVTVAASRNHSADIVGVIADFRPARSAESVSPQIYWPITQYPRFAAYLVVRSSADALVTESVIRSRIAEASPALQASTLTSLNTYFDRTLVSPRFNVMLLGFFAAVAMILAAVGVYGVVAFSVTSRTREIGLRVAMGAAPSQVEMRFLADAIRLAAIGAVAGLGLSLALSRWTQHLVSGMPRIDPVSVAAVTGAFLFVVVVASYAPARRASRIDPIRALAGD